jgi:hypothetical protein
MLKRLLVFLVVWGLSLALGSAFGCPYWSFEDLVAFRLPRGAEIDVLMMMKPR